jgi:sugar-specific transcriptional regulator TrmB
MFLDILTKIGLSDKESKVYLGLLELGAQPASTIAKKAEINRTTCYVILNSLIDKGLVTSYNKASIKYFSASEPDNLLEFIKAQKKRLERYSQELEENIETLYQIEQGNTAKPKLTVFEGFENTKNIYNDILEAKNLKAVTNSDEKPEKLRNFIDEEFDKQRIKKKISIKELQSENTNPKSKIREKLELKDAKTIPQKYKIKTDLYLYDNKISIIFYDNDKFSGVIMESPMLNRLAENTFNLVWDLLD